MKIKFVTSLILAMVLVIIPNLASSQTANTEEQALWQLVDTLQIEHNKLMQEDNDLESSHAIFESERDFPIPETSPSAMLRAEASDYGKRTGLALRGGYTNRTVIDDNGESSAYLQLEWDLLKNGYFEYRDRSETLALRAKLAELKTRHDNHYSNSRCQRYNISRIFSGSRAALTRLKLDLMQWVNAIEQRAYFKGWSQFDDALEAEADTRLLHSTLNYLHGDANFDAYINKRVNPPIIDIDIAALTKAIRSDTLPQSIATLELKETRQRVQADHPNSFRLFLRQDLDVDNRGRDDTAIGFRFIVPLEKQSLNSEYYNAKINTFAQQARYAQWQRLERTRTVYQGLVEQKERAISQQYRYMLAKERLRRTLAKKALGEAVNPALVVIHMRSQLGTAIELIKAKEELYRRVNEVFHIAQLPYARQYIYRASVKTDTYRSRVGSRAIYIWSKTFNHIDNQTLINILKTKGITRALVSSGSKTDAAKLKRFIPLAERDQIKTELLFSDNRWIFPENHDKAELKIAMAAANTGRVHLDIEPHTLPDYQANKEKYLQLYLQMLTRLRQAIPFAELSVALPTHWPNETYQRIARLVDRAYIMSYETDNIATHVKRLSRLLPLLAETKVTLVQRIPDYPDEWALEKSFEHI
ncbi:MAG TPA: hypothetical protein ENJ65_02325, partial [Candidatus Tenderia electrophaga]|nr:hypothetical protein [Candidatus Tenderia electrophaga]